MRACRLRLVARRRAAAWELAALRQTARDRTWTAALARARRADQAAAAEGRAARRALDGIELDDDEDPDLDTEL